MQKVQTDSVSAGWLALALSICMLLGGYATAIGEDQQPEPPTGSEPVVQTTRSGQVPVHLYFGSPDGPYLISETRIIGNPDDPLRMARSILRALINGPRSNLIRTIPAATELRAIFISADNTCVVDFESAIRDNHPGGCRGEMLTVYSIVNSLIINIPSIKEVKLLIEGNDIDTLAGHLSMQSPVPANMLIIR